MNWKLSVVYAAASLMVLMSAGARAQVDDIVLVEAYQGLPPITAEEVIAEAQLRRVPADALAGVLKKPENVEQMALNVFVRRMLAHEAEVAGLDKTPENARKIRLALERMLSDLMIYEKTKDDPEEKVVDNLARHDYETTVERYATPEQVRVSHILLGDSDKAKARELALEIIARLKKGEKFEDLARQYSADPGSKDKGGDLGFFARGRMVKPFEEAAFGLKNPGDLSEPVESSFGIHILRLEERKPAGRKTYDEVKEQLRAQVIGRIRGDRTKVLSEEIKSKAKVNTGGVGAMAEQYNKQSPTP